MNNFYLAIKDGFDGRTIPILWTSAKTYYEEFGQRADQWSWSDPWLVYDNTIEEILETCRARPPHVFGFSLYVWNETFMDELAQQIHAEFPNCLIVYGGPQVDIRYSDDFFQRKPWVDLVCPSDGYGEIIIQEILDQ